MRVSPSSARIPSLLAGVLAACCLAALDISAAPLNDNFANRIPLTGTNLTIQGANTAATTEAGENIGGGLVFLTASVWYKWTAPTSGVVYFSGITPYPNFILGLGVYAGTALNALTQPLSTPDGGFPVAAGDSLAVQIGSVYYLLGGGGGTGPFTLSVRMALPAPTSPNDAFADRLPIALPEYHFVGSIFGATNDPGESLPGSNSVQTLWWSLTAPDEGILNITLAAGEFAAVLTAYEGTSLNSLVPVQPVSGYRYHVHMGHEYLIQLARVRPWASCRRR